MRWGGLTSCGAVNISKCFHCKNNSKGTWTLTHWKRPWCWERLKAEGEGEDRGWDGWVASPTQWAWVWASSRSWWWTGRPGVLQSMGSQRATEGLNWTESIGKSLLSKQCNVWGPFNKLQHYKYYMIFEYLCTSPCGSLPIFGSKVDTCRGDGGVAEEAA